MVEFIVGVALCGSRRDRSLPLARFSRASPSFFALTDQTAMFASFQRNICSCAYSHSCPASAIHSSGRGEHFSLRRGFCELFGASQPPSLHAQAFSILWRYAVLHGSRGQKGTGSQIRIRITVFGRIIDVKYVAMNATHYLSQVSDPIQGEGTQPPSLLSPPGAGSERLCIAMETKLPHSSSLPLPAS
jgi:hypothetical protein